MQRSNGSILAEIYLHQLNSFKNCSMIIEDTGLYSQRLYMRILQNLGLSQDVYVYQAGGKNRVLNLLNEYLINEEYYEDSYRFIIDGDINLISSKVSYTYLNKLHVLDRYSIENFLVCPEGIYDLIIDYKPKEDIDIRKIEEDLEFFYDQNLRQFIRIYSLYALNDLMGLGISTISDSLNYLCSDRFGKLNVKKSREYCKNLFLRMKTTYGNDPELYDYYKDIRRSIKRKDFVLTNISFKDDGLFFLKKFLRGKYGFDVSKEQLVIQLARNSNLCSLKKVMGF